MSQYDVDKYMTFIAAVITDCSMGTEVFSCLDINYNAVRI